MTINGGTLDASGFANTVKSLTITGGGLNLGLGNTLICSGPAVLAGTLNVAGTGTLGSYQLLTYASKSGSFAGNTLDPNYGLLYTATELDAVHKAQVGILTVTAANPTVITGGTTALTVDVGNSAPAAVRRAEFHGFGQRHAATAGSTTGSLGGGRQRQFHLRQRFQQHVASRRQLYGNRDGDGQNSALGGLAAEQRRTPDRHGQRAGPRRRQRDGDHRATASWRMQAQPAFRRWSR